MNPSLKLLLVFLLALEISFVTNIKLNLIIIITCLIYLFFKRVKFKKILFFSLIALLPALGIFFSQFYYGSGFLMGMALFTRLYAYVYLGLSFSLTTYMVDLAYSLEQNVHVPAKFVYGVLAAINLVPRLKYEIKVIRTNGLMRGKVLHPWMPTLYFKALIVAVNWSTNLAKAMQSQGFAENNNRTFAKKIQLNPKDWAIVISILLLIQLIILS